MEDLKTSETWRVFRIQSELVEGFETLHGLGPAVTIFGSARLREDNRYYTDLSLSRPTFYKWLFLSLDYEYTRNNSNIDLFEYERNAVTLSVAANL